MQLMTVFLCILSPLMNTEIRVKRSCVSGADLQPQILCSQQKDIWESGRNEKKVKQWRQSSYEIGSTWTIGQKKGISGEPTLRKEPAQEMRQPMTRAVCEWHMGFSISAVRESQRRGLGKYCHWIKVQSSFEPPTEALYFGQWVRPQTSNPDTLKLKWNEVVTV